MERGVLSRAVDIPGVSVYLVWINIAFFTGNRKPALRNTRGHALRQRARSNARRNFRLEGYPWSWPWRNVARCKSCIHIHTHTHTRKHAHTRTHRFKMSSMEMALYVEELQAAFELQQEHALGLEKRYNHDLENASREIGNGPRLVCLGKIGFVKMTSEKAKQYVALEKQTVWQQIEQARLELHRLELKLIQAKIELKEREKQEIEIYQKQIEEEQHQHLQLN